MLTTYNVDPTIALQSPYEADVPNFTIVHVDDHSSRLPTLNLTTAASPSRSPSRRPAPSPTAANVAVSLLSEGDDVPVVPRWR